MESRKENQNYEERGEDYSSANAKGTERKNRYKCEEAKISKEWKTRCQKFTIWKELKGSKIEKISLKDGECKSIEDPEMKEAVNGTFCTNKFEVSLPTANQRRRSLLRILCTKHDDQ